jgi:steroid 5-alpha reductase family enzyme
MIIVACAAFLSLAMAGAWLVRLKTGNSGWIDAIWSAATGAAGLVAALSAPWSGRSLLTASLVALWSFRLASHIFLRASAGGDDPRYAALAQEWGADFGKRLFYFLQIQAAAALPLVAAAAATARADRAFPDMFDLLGLAVALAGIAGEALADAQLARFRLTAPKGAICETGFWRYSRHPNYFCEFLFWCGWPLIAFGFPTGFVALAAPVFIYWLLNHVSGIPPLEQSMRASRGAAFDAYASRVSRFVPRPPKSS